MTYSSGAYNWLYSYEIIESILLVALYFPVFQHTPPLLGAQFSSLSFADLATQLDVFSWRLELVFQVRRMAADNNNCNANDAGRRRMRATLAFLSMALGAQNSPPSRPSHPGICGILIAQNKKKKTAMMRSWGQATAIATDAMVAGMEWDWEWLGMTLNDG